MQSEINIAFDENEMVTLTNLDLAVTSFHRKIQKRIFPEAIVLKCLQTDTGKFITRSTSMGETRDVMSANAQFLGSYSIPKDPLDSVFWFSPNQSEWDEIGVKVFRPRTHQQCSDRLHSILKHKCVEIPDNMIISFILGEMLDLGKFETIGYISGDDKMLAFGLNNIEWAAELTAEQLYTMPEEAVVVEISSAKEWNSDIKRLNGKTKKSTKTNR